MLSIGGSVRADGKEQDIKAIADLPSGSFRLTSAVLRQNKTVNDAGLSNFKDCKDLMILDLWEAKVRKGWGTTLLFEERH